MSGRGVGVLRGVAATCRAATAQPNVFPPCLPSAHSQRRYEIYGGEREESPAAPPPRREKKYFDMKTFRQHLRMQKQFEEKQEYKELAKTYAKPPPDGWTVERFLRECDIGDNLEDIAAAFATWGDLVSATPEELGKVEIMTNKQRRRLWVYVRLFNHGWWPAAGQEELHERFKGKPLERVGLPWTAEEDGRLLQLADEYDVNFGDPWLYISWAMQRPIDDVRDRYIEKYVKPINKRRECELAVTKASRPLLMARYFKLDPPFLYLVPSEAHFPLAKNTFKLPPAFGRYRKEDCFAPHPEARQYAPQEPVSFQFNPEGKEGVHRIAADKDSRPPQ